MVVLEPLSRGQGNGIRYIVELSQEDGQTRLINLKPDNLIFARGTAVKAAGLKGALELNGQMGFVYEWRTRDSASGELIYTFCEPLRVTQRVGVGAGK